MDTDRHRKLSHPSMADPRTPPPQLSRLPKCVDSTLLPPSPRGRWAYSRPSQWHHIDANGASFAQSGVGKVNGSKGYAAIVASTTARSCAKLERWPLRSVLGQSWPTQKAKHFSGFAASVGPRSLIAIANSAYSGRTVFKTRSRKRQDRARPPWRSQ
jgi:hypothetical protein